MLLLENMRIIFIGIIQKLYMRYVLLLRFVYVNNRSSKSVIINYAMLVICVDFIIILSGISSSINLGVYVINIYRIL